MKTLESKLKWLAGIVGAILLGISGLWILVHLNNILSVRTAVAALSRYRALSALHIRLDEREAAAGVDLLKDLEMNRRILFGISAEDARDLQVLLGTLAEARRRKSDTTADWNPIEGEVFDRRISQTIDREIERIRQAFHSIFYHSDIMPWGGPEIKSDVRLCQSQFDNIVAMDQIRLGLERQIRFAEREAGDRSHPHHKAQYETNDLNCRAALKAWMKDIRRQVLLPGESGEASLRAARGIILTYLEFSKTVESLIDPAQFPGERNRDASLARANELKGRIRLDLDRLEDAVQADFIQSTAGLNRRIFQTSLTSILIFAALALALGVLVIRLIRRMLSSIHALSEGVSTIGRGDLRHRIRLEGEDEMSRLAAAFNDMTQSLDKTTVSKDELNNIISSMLDTLMVMLPDGTISKVNPALCRLLGYESSELIGKSASIVTQAEEPLFRGTILAATLAQNAVENREISYFTRSGQPIPMSLSISAIRNSDGRVVGMVCTARDLRDIRRLVADAAVAAERLKAVELERLASVGRLAGGVAHEINNALTGVLGMAEVLRRGVGRGGELDLLVRETERATKIVQDLLLFARPKLNKLERIELIKTVREVERLAGNDLQIRKIRLDIQAGEGQPAIFGDASQIKQVVLNLLMNAKDAMPDGGEIGIEIRPSPERREMILQVNDSGTGISPGHLSKIFDPFFTTKAPGRGSGLGLSVVRGIVEAHGGRIEASNRRDGGASFSVFLPYRDEPVRPTGESNPAEPKLPKGLHILVVDDESTIRLYCKAVLEPLGNWVTLAGSVDEAWSCLTDRPFDVVLCDQAMPGRTGREFLQALQEKRRPEAARFIQMTGLTSAVPSDTAVLRKPFKAEQLFQSVVEVASPSRRP